MEHEHVIDADGIDITVGSRVMIEYTIVGGGRTEPELVKQTGSVIEITDVDGDVDDEGRSIAILPTVVVVWDGDDENEVDNYSTRWTGLHMDDDAPFQCEDLTVTTIK